MPFLRRAQRDGCKVIVIDPRRTQTAKTADWHLAPVPGTDGVLAMGLGHVLVREGMHDETWLNAHTVGWSQLRERLAQFPPERVAKQTGIPAEEIVKLAQMYGTTRPGLIKIADGINRNRNGGQNVRAILALPAITGQYGTRGGGLSYSSGGYVKPWDTAAIHHWNECPPPGRSVNMNRLGATLLGEIHNPPIKSLYVFGANPAASTPNSAKIVEGLKRDNLFTVVHELFMTDTADYADIVLPATSQLEHTDLHKSYGHSMLTYNHPAIAPLGECKSNWEVMGLLSSAMGFDEPWLHQTPDEVIEEVLTATAVHNAALRGITLKELKAGSAVPLHLESTTPHTNGYFPTPSGKVELYSQALADAGYDPLPGNFVADGENISDSRDVASSLWLITPASHHFVSSSLANQEGLRQSAGIPTLEIHPADAAERNIRTGDTVVVENERGWCRFPVRVTENVRRGVVATPKGHWAKHNAGRNANWTTPDALADMAGQSTFHSNRVWVRLSP
jgi:anaerobic selenocysteine-containing dehydrogenase